MNRRSVALLSLLVVALVAAVALGLLGRSGESNVARVQTAAVDERERVDATLLAAPAEAVRVGQESAPPDAPSLFTSESESEAVGPREPLIVCVVDSAGRPVAGADVLCRAQPKEPFPMPFVEQRFGEVVVAVGRTEADGTVVFADAVAALDKWGTSARLRVRRAGFAPLDDVRALVRNDTCTVTLLRPAAVVVSGWIGDPEQRVGAVEARLDDDATEDHRGWMTTADGRRAHDAVKPGERAARIAWDAPDGVRHYSDVFEFELEESETRELHLELHPPVTVKGRLASNVPRPIVAGVVEVRVGCPLYAQEPMVVESRRGAVRGDGTFEVGDLPRGPVEVTAACAGWASSVGHGATSLAGNEVVFMERTGSVTLRLRDPRGELVAGARVAVLLQSGQYHPAPSSFVGRKFSAITGANGTVHFDEVPGRFAFVLVRHPALRQPPPWEAEMIELVPGGSAAADIALVPR